MMLTTGMKPALPAVSAKQMAAGSAVLPVRGNATPQRAPRVLCRAGPETEEKVENTVEQAAISIGLDPSEGIFGFTPLAELWTGRAAMIGVISAFTVELTNGGVGALGQIGLESPNPDLGYLILGLTAIGCLVGTTVPLVRVSKGEMSDNQVGRYANALGLRREAEDIKQSKKDLNIFDDGKEGAPAATPADAVLGLDNLDKADEEAARLKADSKPVQSGSQEAAEADATAAEMKSPSPSGPSVSLKAKEEVQQTQSFAMYDEAFEYKFAKDVELTNGRYAMLGFWGIILIEAFTGHGILLQLVDWGKITGLLGAESGF